MIRKLSDGEDWLSRHLSSARASIVVAFLSLVPCLMFSTYSVAWPPGDPRDRVPAFLVGLVSLTLALFSTRKGQRLWQYLCCALALTLTWLFLLLGFNSNLQENLGYPWLAVIPAVILTLTMLILRRQWLPLAAFGVFLITWFSPLALPPGSTHQTARVGNLIITCRASYLELRTADRTPLSRFIAEDWIRASSSIGPIIHPKEPWVMRQPKSNFNRSTAEIGLVRFTPTWARWETLEVEVGLLPKPVVDLRMPLLGAEAGRAATLVDGKRVEISLNPQRHEEVDASLTVPSDWESGTAHTHIAVETDAGERLNTRFSGVDAVTITSIPRTAHALRFLIYRRPSHFSGMGLEMDGPKAMFVFERVPLPDMLGRDEPLVSHLPSQTP